MKIGFIIYPGVLNSGPSNGVRSQALAWREALELLGQKVELVDLWGGAKFSSFDIVHFFGSGHWLKGLAVSARNAGARVVQSPIIDSNRSWRVYRIAASLKIPTLRLGTLNSITSEELKISDRVLVRSMHEETLVIKGLGVPAGKVELVPLGVKMSTRKDDSAGDGRLDRCLHVSSFTQDRKNVARLIRACHKANIGLDLVGNKGSEFERWVSQFEPEVLKDVVFHGFVSEEELDELYRTRKIFALPSLEEGVGLVALDAAARGCEIVITELGGPKEYHGGHAVTVDPFSVASIAGGLAKARERVRTRDLSNHIRAHHSVERSAARLLETYRALMEQGGG